jgi:hypothetical protein
LRKQSITDRLQPTPYPVALHGRAHLFADDEAEPYGSRFRGDRRLPYIYDSGARRDAHTTSDGRPIVGSSHNAVGFGEHRERLSREFGAALAATVREDRATGTRAHAKAEAVHLGTTTVVGLEGSLAHLSLSSVRLRFTGDAAPTGKESFWAAKTAQVNRLKVRPSAGQVKPEGAERTIIHRKSSFGARDAPAIQNPITRGRFEHERGIR